MLRTPLTASFVAAALVAAVPGAPLAQTAAGVGPTLSETRGPAVSGGLGSEFGNWFGIQLAYYVPLPGRRLHIAPHAGITPPVLGSTAMGAAVGTSLVYGRTHRLVGDLTFGRLFTEELALHVNVVDRHETYGPTVAAGYEYVSNPGFMLRVTVGVSYPLDARVGGSNSRPEYFDGTLGLGWKLW